MANLRNCKRCGRLFVYNGNSLCERCREEDEEIFRKVREYIEKHPRSTTFEVAEALDISVDKILRFLREGKLELSNDNVNMLLECERCGKPINTGRYCGECAVIMDREFKGRMARSSVVTGQNGGAQMFTANRRKREK